MPASAIIVASSQDHPGQSALVPWWSFTKTLLAGAALALVGQGRLDLDQPLRGKPYNLRQLLQHTSGLPDYAGLPDYHAAVTARAAPWTVEDLLRRVQSDRLLFAPGASWSYSNIGYLFVRQVIERLMNAELDDALHALLFDPLGAKEVFIATSVEHLEATSWLKESSYHPGWVYHGLAVGTASTAAWILDRFLYSAFLPARWKAQMLGAIPVGRPLPSRPFVAPTYGLGLMIDLQSPFGRMVGHTGQGPGSTAAVYSFPDLTPPRTLAAFVARDGPDAAGALETHIQSLVR